MLTLMAVHAHPDDEATTTGGILAKYAAEGIRTVLVTCTDGALGDSADSKAGEEGHGDDHDHDALVALREQELRASCEVLGISHLELLGYRDSGMMGWPTNDAAGSFWSLPVDEAAKPLIALFEKYQPDVVVTYDDFGFYGHPDHIQAHRITMAALEATGSSAKLYFPTFRRSRVQLLMEQMRTAGADVPDVGDDFGSPDEAIGATVDCEAFAETKRASLAAHASQADNIMFLQFTPEAFRQAFGTEEFLRIRPEGPGVESDLFAGLR
jgi:LmbE family N-acetylglucosaminyl deacetylase